MKSYRTFFTLFITIIIIELFVYFIQNFNNIASFFFKSENSTNGELLKVVLTSLGGLAIFIGLWFNSKRIKEQTRQNEISEHRNNDQRSYDADKRFGEAIGYLGNENTSIVLGGIYALYQLAKEDKRYRSIVAGLYTSYLREKSEGLNSKLEKKISKRQLTKAKPPVEIETIISLLFSNKSIFYGENLDFSNTTLKYVNFNGDVSNCSFDSSLLTDCKFNANIQNCHFEFAELKNSRFGTPTSIIDNCVFHYTVLDTIIFSLLRINKGDFKFAFFNDSSFLITDLNDCNFLGADFKDKVEFSNTNSFSGTVFNKESKEFLKFKNCKNQEEIIYL